MMNELIKLIKIVGSIMVFTCCAVSAYLFFVSDTVIGCISAIFFPVLIIVQFYLMVLKNK